jgi:hypothetical protein
MFLRAPGFIHQLLSYLTTKSRDQPPVKGGQLRVDYLQFKGTSWGLVTLVIEW